MYLWNLKANLRALIRFWEISISEVKKGCFHSISSRSYTWVQVLNIIHLAFRTSWTAKTSKSTSSGWQLFLFLQIPRDIFLHREEKATLQEPLRDKHRLFFLLAISAWCTSVPHREKEQRFSPSSRQTCCVCTSGKLVTKRTESPLSLKASGRSGIIVCFVPGRVC